MAEAAVNLSLERADALVLFDCISRMFDASDFHDWESASLSLMHEAEQYPLRDLEDQLGSIFQKEATDPNWAELIQSARDTISAREWGE